RYIMVDKIKSLYGRQLADQYLADLESHVLYKHDESGTPGYPYCVALTMYPVLVSGLRVLGGVSIAPTALKSFCGEFINLVYSISSQFMGAVATPEFLMYLDYFIRKDYGDDYIEHLDDVVEMNVKQRTLRKVIDNYFQQVVHSMNMPAGNRGYQTVFWNIGYFDKPYFEGVFGDFRFPDGSAPKWESLSWLQKHFMNWFNEERNNYILTFPVETMALLTDGGDDYADKEYADFTAEMWAKGHSFFCYISNSPDSLSSCCRLRNSLKDLGDSSHNHTTHQYSMGTASVATGSKSVMTINLNRLIQDATRRYFLQEKGVNLEAGKPLGDRSDFDREVLYRDYINKDVREMTERVHQYQIAFNEIIKDFLKADMLDVYKAGFIDMKKQYLTVGVNGLTEAAEFLGLKVSPNPDYNEFVNTILETINIANRKDRTDDAMFNTEFVPAENLAAKNYKWDKKDGYFVSEHHNLYSSYFYNPEDESLSIIDKFKLHGEDYVKYLDGGSALHMNIAEHLTKDQYRELLNVAAHYGTNYFTFNCRNTVCNECGYISKDTLESCPKCGSRNLDYLTRVIGYLKRISSFSEARQQEAAKRFYIND
ncbi:MAG: ribonucleoside-triphosphate reductase, partial [Bacteroidales bacterium]|nr:ribonucleoside-triphosphate reductase [Bacteroidales bacterium]